METIHFLTFYLLIWLMIYLTSRIFNISKVGLKVGPFWAQYKTRIFNGLIERLGRYRKLWRITGSIAVALAFGQMMFISISLTRNMFLLRERAEGAYPVVPVLPGLTISWSILPYVLLALVVMFVSHEVAHGVVSVAEGVPIKSSGLFLLFILGGAFVEIDEEKLRKVEIVKRLRIFAAGSAANISLGILFILLMASFPYSLAPFYSYTPQGVVAVSIIEGSGAYDAGLERWTVIREINGTIIHDSADLSRVMKEIRPNDLLLLDTSQGYNYIITQPHPLNSSRGLMGIVPFEYYPPKVDWMPVQLPYHILMLENWMYIVLVSVALFNMLPLYPFDGGRILESMLKIMKLRRADRLIFIVTTIFAIILIANFLLSFIRYGWKVSA